MAKIEFGSIRRVYSCMRKTLCLLAMAVSLSAFAENVEKPKDIEPLNRTLTAAAAKGESWTADPALIGASLTGTWRSADPGAEPASQSREIVARFERQGEKAIVVVKEIGLFDDAVHRIDHTYELQAKDGSWRVTAAKVKAYDARPPFPELHEDLQKRRAGFLICWSSTGQELEEQAKENGIADFSGLVTRALDGNGEALAGVLKFAAKADGAAAEIYAELAFGLSCVFDHQTFRRFLFFNVGEEEREAFDEFIEWISTDLIPE